MPFRPLPPHAAWQHHGSRSGFEVSFFAAKGGGWSCVGSATAVQDDLPYIVDYRIELDLSWHTRHAQIRCREHADSDPCAATVISDGCGHWSIDYSAPSLDFRSLLVFDAHGLVLDYPGIAIRAA